MHSFVHECRIKSKLTPKQLSKLLNISVHTYLAMEQHKLQFKPEIIVLLSRIYQIPLINMEQNQNMLLDKIEKMFSALNEEERFFYAMKNLTGKGSFKSDYRAIKIVKDEVLDDINK